MVDTDPTLRAMLLDSDLKNPSTDAEEHPMNPFFPDTSSPPTPFAPPLPADAVPAMSTATPTLPRLPTLAPRLPAATGTPATVGLPRPAASTAAPLPPPTVVDPVDAYLAEALPDPGPQVRRPAQQRQLATLGTRVPHIVCVLGFLMGIAAGVAEVVVRNNEPAGSVDRSVDTSALSLLTSIGGLLYGFGWLVWTVFAARNARIVNRRALTPWTVPIQIVLTIGVVTVMDRANDGIRGTAVLVTLLLIVVIHLWVLGNFRHTAAMIGAEQHYWTRLMWITPATFMGAIVVTAVVGRADDLLGMRAGFGVLLFGSLMTAWTIHLAMDGWERALVRKVERRHGEQVFSKLLG